MNVQEGPNCHIGLGLFPWVAPHPLRIMANIGLGLLFLFHAHSPAADPENYERGGGGGAPLGGGRLRQNHADISSLSL